MTGPSASSPTRPLDRDCYEVASDVVLWEAPCWNGQRLLLILRVKLPQFRRVLSCKGGLLPMYLLHRALLDLLPLVLNDFLTQVPS